MNDPAVPLLRDLDANEVSRRRFATLGLLPVRHPLSLWRLPPQRQSCRSITAAMRGRSVAIIARCITRKQVAATYSTDGDGTPLDQPRFEAMSFVTMEDETGQLETVWFPDTYRRFGVLLEQNEPLRLTGRVDVSFGSVSMTVSQVEVVRCT